MSNCIDRMWLLFSSCKAVAVGPEVVAVPPEIFFVWVRGGVLEKFENSYVELFLSM